jgi:hypothetical protein
LQRAGALFAGVAIGFGGLRAEARRQAPDAARVQSQPGAASVTATGTPIGCDRETSLRPVNSDAATTISLTNTAGRAVKLYRLGVDGSRQYHGPIQAGHTSTLQTYLNQFWVVVDASGACAAIFETRSQPQNGKKIDRPEMYGSPLHYCLFASTQCGWPAANIYCQMNGYVAAGGYERARSNSPTKILGGGTSTTCEPSTGRPCDTFAYVYCAK